MLATTTTLMGWTVDQWACVAAWYELTRQYLPLPSYRATRELQCAWRRMRVDEPGPILVEAAGRYSMRDIMLADKPLPPVFNELALRNLRYAMQLWARSALEDGGMPYVASYKFDGGTREVRGVIPEADLERYRAYNDKEGRR